MNHLNFSQIFSVFSRREKAAATVSKPLTPEFRYRVFQLCADTFDYSSYELWSEMHNRLQYLHGRPSLTGRQMDSDRVDVLTFLSQCSDEHFLDFVEYIFQSRSLWRLSVGEIGEDRFVNNINEFLRIDDLPYFLTGFVREQVQGVDPVGRKVITIETVYPQIIRRDNEVLHEQAIQPALTFLTNPAFKTANNEFLEALKDFRKGENADCIAKCGSSFESVMKVICARKKWPYHQTDTAQKLLDTITNRAGMESFFKDPVMLIATMRNRISSAHGAGTQERNVPEHRAQYAINATASAILLLVEETKP